MKKFYFFLFLVSNIVWGQNNKIQGVIKDANTLQPIPYVSIYSENDFKNNSSGSISNEKGEFAIQNNKSKITFSHINYELFTIEPDAISKEILLTPKNYVLDEIVISNENPKEYLKKIIDLSQNKIDKNILLKGYCREIVKIKNNYTKFSDALVEYYIKKNNGKSVLLLGQHRAMKSDILDGVNEEDIESMNTAFNVKNYVRGAYHFEKIENMLKGDEYEFERRIKREANGEAYEYIEFLPKEDSKELLNSGYVIFDPKAKCILEYKFYTSEKHLKNAKKINIVIAKMRLNKSLVWAKFKFINNQYILNYFKVQNDIYLKIGKKIDHNFDFLSDLFIYEFKDNVEIPDNGYNKRTLFEAGNNYTEEFWKNYNVFPLSESEENFIKSVQQKSTNSKK